MKDAKVTMVYKITFYWKGFIEIHVQIKDTQM